MTTNRVELMPSERKDSQFSFDFHYKNLLYSNTEWFHQRVKLMEL